MKMNLKICFFILHNLCNIVISSYSLHADDEYKKDENGICRNGYCGSNSYYYILKVFGGLLHSRSELLMLDNVNNKAVATPLSGDDKVSEYELRHPQADDGDICCSTHVQHKINTTMINIFGESMNIIHLSDATEPSYQYTPYASCVQTGSCTGECVIENKIITLLAMDTNEVLKFCLFEVPWYCSCKNSDSSTKY